MNKQAERLSFKEVIQKIKKMAKPKKPTGHALPIVSAPILHSVLSQLNYAISIDKLKGLYQEQHLATEDNTPVKKLKWLFEQAGIDDISFTMDKWRLAIEDDVTVLYVECQWWIVQKYDGDTVILINHDGKSKTIKNNHLDNCDTFRFKRVDLKKDDYRAGKSQNPAAQMVLDEIFKSKRWLAEVLIATTLVNILAIATSIFAMQVYDRVVPTLSYATLWTLVMGMVIVISMSWVLKMTRAKILDSLSSEVSKNISQKLFDHMMHIQLDKRPQSLGTMAAQVSGLDSVKNFFTSSVMFTLVDAPFALIFITFIAIIGGLVSFVYLGLLPIAILIGVISQRLLRDLMAQNISRSNERQGLLVDAIRGSESIRAANSTWRFNQKWANINKSINGYQIRQKAISNFTSTSTTALASMAYVFAIVVGVSQIEAGSLTMGGLIACSILGGKVISPISRCVQLISQWQQVSQSLEMANKILTLKTERPAGSKGLMPTNRPTKIELIDLEFAYQDSPVLQLNVPQLTFKAGDRVALVGPIGSGKSTLLKVLAGMYQPSRGLIKLDNINLWDIQSHVIGNWIGYLPQHVHLFKGTLLSNLLVAGEVDDQRLLDVMQGLDIAKIAEQSPDGIELSISEGGEGLSYGQRQLVGLARVVLSKANIWLLDEPTASMDMPLERKVISFIESQLGKDDILIMSTHRPALAQKIANRMIHMEQGQIKADGGPEKVLSELMHKQQQVKARGKNIGEDHAI